MNLLRKLALCFVATVAVASARAQAAPAAAQVGPFAVTLELLKSRVVAGQNVLAGLTFANTSRWMVPMPQECGHGYDYSARVVGKDGDVPPETEFGRHTHGDWRPGDTPELPIFVCASRDEEIPFGQSGFQGINLSRYYDLSKPGRYSVYMVLGATKDGKMIRSNTVEFEVQAPNP